ncbi:ubiquinone biosynthesis monooxygenase COQ6, mitochondrial [Selaginella moellendorffii]|nr:ubiquinone biosynthesis monooxygenase COQ6, mitochondrial [Selaginella moellendorffii]|eukprot:XP_002965486.2 ubiquinone biosynthesis monooxygenase COQ6, mitochondrial [Selaginella moellendorffii]
MLRRGAARFRSGAPAIAARALLSQRFSGASFCSSSAAIDQGAGSSQSSSEPYDVVIVGGGMVGAAVACGLVSSPLTRSLKIAVIDGSPISFDKVKKSDIPDPRVSSITPATVSFCKDIGTWDDLKSKVAPFDSMQVWDYAGLGYTRYNAADVDEPVLGYVVENGILVSSLRARLQGSDVDLLCPTQVDSVIFPHRVGGLPEEEGSNWAHVSLKDGRSIATRLVVGADGGKSKVRKMAGISTTGWDYMQEGLICTVRVDEHHSTAWQRFLPTGPLALLPMNDDFSNIVWSTTPKKAKELKSLPSEDFVNAVNNALTKDFSPPPKSGFAEVLTNRFLSPYFGNLAPSATEEFQFPVKVKSVETDRLSFPLSLSHARSYAAPRVVLVGDAAHTVHPLAGQGVNLGFGDAAALIKVLEKGVRCGLDVGEISLLNEYENTRKFANLPMMAVLDGFQRIFSTDSGPVNALRAAGFNLVQSFGPLKKLVISSAMSNGFSGLPGLLRI